MEGNRAGETGEELVVGVAISGGRKSKYILRWALEKFVPEGDVTFKLFHGYPKVTSVPTPMGNWIPIAQAREDVAEGYRKEIEWKKRKSLLPYQQNLKAKKIKADLILLETDDIAMAITLEIAKHSIRHLVIGVSSTSIFSRKNIWKMGENLSSVISENAPTFCTVYVIADGKLQYLRPADSEPDVITVDDTSGLSNISTDSSSGTSSLTLGRLLKSVPSSPRNPGSIPSESSASVTKRLARELIDVGENATNMSLGNASVVSQSSSSGDGSWVSDQTSLGGSFLGTGPSSRSQTSFAEITPAGSFVGTPPTQGYFVGTGTPPTGTSFVGTPHTGSFVGTAPMGSGSLVGTPPTGSGYFAGTPTKRQSPPAGSPMGASQGQFSELEQLRTELRHMEQMYELAQNSNGNEKLKEEKAKEAASIEKKSDSGEHAQRITPHKKAENKAARQVEENENKLKKILGGSVSQFQKFSWKEIEAATSYFSDEFKIGMGAFGTVYKCKLHHTTVAVKVLHSKDSATNKQFVQELEILSTIRHPHLLLLLGAVPEESCLIYEYMENGSLDDRLFRKANTPPLPWYDRFRICWEVAASLAFLHSTKPQPIIHRDLKPANILLDQNLVSKIGDAGLGTMMNVEPSSVSLKTLYKETSPVGTLCYIDPEYQRTGRVSTKSDVYALGVVILQLLTAKPAVGIAYLVEDAIDEGTLMEILDPEAGNWPEKEALEMALLGLQCAELRGRDRPDLRDRILPALERLKELADSARESASNAPTGPPSHFICPLLKDIMEDPYVAADGYTYDRKAIEQWLREHDTSPTTNLPLPHKFIMPNYTQLEAIKQWKSKRGTK